MILNNKHKILKIFCLENRRHFVCFLLQESRNHIKVLALARILMHKLQILFLNSNQEVTFLAQKAGSLLLLCCCVHAIGLISARNIVSGRHVLFRNRVCARYLLLFLQLLLH